MAQVLYVDRIVSLWETTKCKYLDPNTTLHRVRDQTRFEAPLFPEEQQRQEDLPRRAAAAAAAVSFPIDVAEKNHRFQMAKERVYRPKLKRTLHRSFGVTSRRSQRRNESDVRQALKPPLLGHSTTDKSPTWLPTKTSSSPHTTLFLSDLFSPEAPGFNVTMAMIKDYIRKHKKTRMADSQSSAEERQGKVFFTMPHLHTQKLLEEEEGMRKLNLKFVNNRKKSNKGKLKRPYVQVKARSRPKKIKVGYAVHSSLNPDFVSTALAGGMSPWKSLGLQEGLLSNLPSSTVDFIKNLGARIEAEEAERLAADGENPLKYLVKDGILYKKNKVPVARISLPVLEVTPSTPPPTLSTTVKSSLIQTMVESSRVVSESANAFNRAASRPGFKPSAPISPPTAKVARSPELSGERHVMKWRGEGIMPADATILSRTVSQEDDVTEESIPPPPMPMPTNDLIAEVRDPPPYPFSHCYMNMDGFMCCNRFLESLMRRSFRKLRKAHRFHDCSVQKIANRIQLDAENV
ncbi:unnamed protein product [Heligmosomoides polygyrus]|uniref:Uncharacterized protein n=1 Tax=Heligmosomoides polygyrus TaxID=6339 RepID=A0A3P8B574_HELPZ|nr:unnamed protein product [Heligmosomoides polygyrus]